MSHANTRSAHPYRPRPDSWTRIGHGADTRRSRPCRPSDGLSRAGERQLRQPCPAPGLPHRLRRGMGATMTSTQGTEAPAGSWTALAILRHDAGALNPVQFRPAAAPTSRPGRAGPLSSSGHHGESAAPLVLTPPGFTQIAESARLATAATAIVKARRSTGSARLVVRGMAAASAWSGCGAGVPISDIGAEGAECIEGAAGTEETGTEERGPLAAGDRPVRPARACHISLGGPGAVGWCPISPGPPGLPSRPPARTGQAARR